MNETNAGDCHLGLPPCLSFFRTLKTRLGVLFDDLVVGKHTRLRAIHAVLNKVVHDLRMTRKVVRYAPGVCFVISVVSKSHT